MVTPVIRLAWGGRPADAARVAEALQATLRAVPMPAIPRDEGWFDLERRSPVPDSHEGWVDLLESHGERDPEGAALPLAGFMLTLARGDGRSTDSTAPWVEVSADVGSAISGPRVAANQVDVLASSGWSEVVSHEELVRVMRALVEIWAPSWAVVVDRPLMRGKPEVPARTPWPGYASYFADAIVPGPVFSDSFRVSRFAAGALAVLEEPWETSRVIEEIPRFLEASTWERIPQGEGRADPSDPPPTAAEAYKALHDEGLTHWSWFESSSPVADEAGIRRDGRHWVVFATDERAAEAYRREYDEEGPALADFLQRVRATTTYFRLRDGTPAVRAEELWRRHGGPEA